MSIPFFTHLREYERHKDLLMQSLSTCIESSKLILGERVEQLEQYFAQYTEKSGGVGVASGTDALAMALRILDIGAGDEVITVANTCTPTVAAIRITGAIPRFVDIDPHTLQMDTTKIEQKITKQTKCIMPVHLFGNAVDMHTVCSIAKERHLSVIEDCAQAYGTIYAGKPVGSYGDVGCFSFYPTKNLGAWGDGGMCTFSNESHVSEAKKLRMYGYVDGPIAEREGINSRLDELQASLLLAKLSYIDEDLARRRYIAGLYEHALQTSSFSPVLPSPNTTHSYHLYVVQHPHRKKVMTTLQQHEIGCAIHYPMPIHMMPAYAFLGYKENDLPVTEEVAHKIISLPMFPYLTDEEISTVCAALQHIDV